MLHVGIIAACLAAALALPDAAAALTIVNRDEHDHKVTIVEGSRSTDHVLKPEAQVENVCLKGCVVRLDDGDEDDEYNLDGDDDVFIDTDGELYYERPLAPASPPAEEGKAGDGKGPPQKK